MPVLHGQPAEFLAAALDAYASARRASGIMQPVATDLGRDEIDRVARYYAGLPPPVRRSELRRMRPVPSSAGARSPSAAIRTTEFPPAPVAMRRQALKTYPRLAGQNAPYMTNRLRLWKNGLAPGTDGEAIMAPIARALNERQIEDVSAYFASTASQRPRRHDETALQRLALGGTLLLLAGCGTDVQSVMTPRGTQAGQIADARLDRLSLSARSCWRSWWSPYGSRSAGRRACALRWRRSGPSSRSG